jgi:EAL domain-containing protein (putative c-di-GMP-specific phosphodiesterase class I)
MRAAPASATPSRLPSRSVTPRGAFVADFHFSRRGVEPDVAGAKRRLLVFGAIAALCFYLGILPLLARLARRLPSPVHPRHRAALAELRRALEDGELCVHYQPQVDIVTGAPIGVEALVRWQHPQRGLLGPPAFLLDAERSPATRSALTRRVLDLAVGDCARWTREGRELPVAVNIAASLLIDGSIVGSVAEALASHSLDAHLLTVEITETAIMQATDAASVVGELRNLGVAVSIDDFGTGHSSLARMRSLPLDELKIDRAFVRTIAADDRDLAIVQLIADLGAGFGLRVVAEGVEDDHTVTLLRSVGCAAAQGYLFAPPLPERDLLAWMDERTEALGSAAHGSRDVR